MPGSRGRAPGLVFCIVDPSLKDFVGHHFEYDRSVAAAAAAAGYVPYVLGHRDVLPEIQAAFAVEPAFRRDMWGQHPSARLLGGGVDQLRCNFDHLADLRTALRRQALPPGSVLFAHMITAKQLFGLALQVVRTPASRDIETILLLRYQPSLYAGPAGAAAFRLLEWAVRHGRHLRLASDSARLAAQLERLTTLPVEVFPIPHTDPPGHPAAHPLVPPKQPGRLRFVSLGNARDEKGYLEILQAIRSLAHSPEGLAGLEFVLQSNDPLPDIAEAIAAFSRELPDGAVLLHRSMPSEAYRALLHSADVVLVPYWRSIYEARTSGVFLEAVAAGKPVIATRDTWMGDELAAHGAGILIGDRSVEELAAAIREVARDHTALAAAAARGAVACLQVHSAEALVAQAATRPAPRAPHRPSQRVAVLYPWGDLHERRSGASVRCASMVETIARHVAEVRVLQPGGGGDTVAGNIRIESYDAAPRTRQRLARRALAALTRPLLGRQGRGQDAQLWLHLERRLDPDFRRRVNRLVRWADVVLLEYSYWGGVVLPIARRHGVPVVASTYDIVSAQVDASRLVRWATRCAEIRGLRRADHVVCVSPGDAAVLRRHGLAPALIANPVDLARLDAALPTDPRRLLAELYDITLPDGPIALFVGSRYAPNVAAAERLAALAQADASGVVWVLAGGCAEPRREGRLVALGTVAEPVLTALYGAATAVVVPLAHGTGTSLKTLEALAAARPVVGTAIGFRGLDVQSGRDCRIEDDVACYPAIVAELAAAPARAAALGQAGRAFAERSDRWRVFQAYLPLLGLPPMPEDEIAAAQAAERERHAVAMLRQLAARAVDRELSDLSGELAARLLAHAPGDAEALFIMGSLLAREPAQAAAAIDHLRRAEAAGFDPSRTRFGIATAYAAAEEHTAAARETERAALARVATVEGEAQFGRFVMECWDRHGRRQYRSVVALTEAMLRRRRQAGLHFLLANSLHELGEQPERALAQYDAALQGGFDAFWANYHQGVLLAALGRQPEAHVLFGRAVAATQDPERREMAARHLAPEAPPDPPAETPAPSPADVVPDGGSDAGTGRAAGTIAAGDGVAPPAPARQETGMLRAWRDRAAQLRRLWRMPGQLHHRIDEATAATLEQFADVRRTQQRLDAALQALHDAAAEQAAAQSAQESARQVAAAQELARTTLKLAELLAGLREAMAAVGEQRAATAGHATDLHEAVAAHAATLRETVIAAAGEQRAETTAHAAEVARIGHLLEALGGEIDARVRAAIEELVPARVDALIVPRHADLRNLIMDSIYRGDAAVTASAEVPGFIAESRRSRDAAERRLRRLEDVTFDLLAALRPQGAAATPRLALRTEHKLAAASADHLHPRGTLNDDTRHPPFVAACERHFGRAVRHLDLGCAGGGLVWDFIRAGHLSCGVEGSDLSLRTRRAYWAVIPQALFTADITRPFSIVDAEGNPQPFDVITAWEVLEHIDTASLGGLFDNILAALAPDGLFIASVSTFPDADPATGAVWHVTVQPRDWWLARAAEHGLRPVEAGFAIADFARGSGNPRADDWDEARDSALGFHLVLGRG